MSKLIISFIVLCSIALSASADDKSQKKKHKQMSERFTCGEKHTCKQMNSCAEAMFYLNKCGVQKLDRDHDGVPCESICR